MSSLSHVPRNGELRTSAGVRRSGTQGVIPTASNGCQQRSGSALITQRVTGRRSAPRRAMRETLDVPKDVRSNGKQDDCDASIASCGGDRSDAHSVGRIVSFSFSSDVSFLSCLRLLALGLREAAAGICCNATFSTSSIHFTGRMSSVLLMFCGISARSRSVLFRDQHRVDAAAMSRQQFLLQTADRQHLATQRDLTGHGNIGTHGNSGQRGHQRRAHGRHRHWVHPLASHLPARACACRYFW